jgi:outer membrane protein
MIALALALLAQAAAPKPAQPVSPPPNVQPTSPANGPAPEQGQPAGRDGMTLDQAIQLSLRNNPDLARARYQSLSAEQDITISRAAILPTLDFNASVGKSREGGGITTPVDVNGQIQLQTSATTVRGQYNAGLTLHQLVFDGGKWWNNLDSAELQHASTKANVDEQQLNTVFNVEQKFYELVRQQRQLKVLGDAAIRSRDQADFTQRLFEGGRATQADVYAARANRDNDEINRLGQEARVELARQDLAIAIGIDPSASFAIQEPSQMQREPIAPPPAGEAVEKALASRPGLKAFALAADAQRKSKSAAKGDYWPVVSLDGQYLRHAQDLDTFTSSPEKASTLSGSVNLTWNIFQGLRTNATVEKAQIAVLQAESDLAAGRRTVVSDVERAIAQLAAARQQARIAAQSVETAGENLRLARTRQQVGVGTQLEVRDAELKLTQSELARTNALVDGHEAESALRRAVGG